MKAFCFGCLVLLALCVTEAEAQNEDACMGVLAKQAPKLNVEKAFCTALAGFIFTNLTTPEAEAILAADSVGRADVFSQRDLQNRSSQQAELAGTPAQGHAIPSVQPAGVASGTIAAVGNRSRPGCDCCPEHQPSGALLGGDSVGAARTAISPR